MSETRWDTAFDHFDPAWAANPFPIWDELRTGCPVARSSRFRDRAVPTRMTEIVEVTVAVERFLSRVPTFGLADPDAGPWSTGQVRGPRTLPITS